MIDKAMNLSTRGGVFELFGLVILAFLLTLVALKIVNAVGGLTLGPTAYSMVVQAKPDPLPPAVQTIVKPAISVFFGNGSAKLTQGGIETIDKMRAILIARFLKYLSRLG